MSNVVAAIVPSLRKEGIAVDSVFKQTACQPHVSQPTMRSTPPRLFERIDDWNLFCTTSATIGALLAHLIFSCGLRQAKVVHGDPFRIYNCFILSDRSII